MDSKKPGTKNFRKPVRRTERSDTAPRDGERIAKRLARAGVASRRDAEDMVAAGRITVNGKVLSSPAFNVTANDRIEIDGNPIPAIERTRLFLFHKPAGVVTTNRDPEGRKTVFDILPKNLPRLLTVGRLDMTTEGLLLLTNDGGLARILELPATGWLRRYRVRVHGEPDAAKLDALKDGIAIDGVFYGSVEAAVDRIQGSNAWLTVSLREGKNREVRNIMTSLGLSVTRLIRVSYGPFQLADLAVGEIREIKGRTLRDQLGERLIAESGANFDAPVITQFSSKSVDEKDRRPGGSTGASARTEHKEQARRSKPADRRLEALDRLQTKPSGPSRKGNDRDGTRDRASHVWMAPGARPVGKKKSEAQEARNERSSKAGPRKDAARKDRARTDRQREASGDMKRGEKRFSRSDRNMKPDRSGPPRGKGNADRRR